MSYKSVREILNAVFDSDDSSLKTIFKTDGEVLNMVLDESEGPALKVSMSGSVGLSDDEKTVLAKASKNYLINPFDNAFVINQRDYVSGSTLADGQYGYDRWKASGGNSSITYSGGYYVLTSGTIEQVIEAPALAGQTLTLSADTGGTTVNCTVDGQSGTLPFTVTIAGTGNISVKLTGGKVRNVKLGYNNTYVSVNLVTELLKCKRYYQRHYRLEESAYGVPSSTIYRRIPLYIQMRTTPTLLTVGTYAAGSINISAYSLAGNKNVGYFTLAYSSTVVGYTLFKMDSGAHIEASAEL